MENFEICRISMGQLCKVVDGFHPRGLFLAYAGGRWIAVDNSTGYAWTEEFRLKRRAIRWLRGSFEVS